jgi:hypothetical protein
MDWSDIITKMAAAVGAGLGIFNAWNGWRQRRVHIDVIPTSVQIARQIDISKDGSVIYRQFSSPGVLVRNLSSFPVVFEEIGYDFIDGESYCLSRIVSPGRWSEGGRWMPDELPQKVEARTSLRMALWDKDEEKLKNKQIRRAYAKTACGITAHGRNRALRKVFKRLTYGYSVFEPLEKSE